MDNDFRLEQATHIIATIISSPFEWRPIPGGPIILEDASMEGGTRGGDFRVADFWMAKYPVTNAQYQRFIDDPQGFRNPRWWEFSPQARQWRMDHPSPKPTAFPGDRLPRTRVSWFDSMAFCAWLDAQWRQQDSQAVAGLIRLPTEGEWQRAALGDTGWHYPWGNEMEPQRCNYGNQYGHPTPVDTFVDGKSFYGVMDMIGNAGEWTVSDWGNETIDLSGYTYRSLRGGAWNNPTLEYLRATSRYGHPPRGQLNDAGFRFMVALKA